MSKFSIIHDLDGLSPEQTAQYLRDVSVHFGLDPDLNAFDVLWMDSGDGRRKKVVYARKGTTDILRDIHEIEVSSLIQHDGPGYVSFTATGTNKKRRQEIAVGAHSTEGLKGQRLADSIMTAQTRALRRLTLQFVGGGILDVSEVGTTTDINTSPASLAQLAGSAAVIPPQMAPIAPAPGKDITDIDESKVLLEIAADPGFGRVDAALAASTPPAPDLKAEKAPKKRTSRKRNTVDLTSPGQAPTAPVQTEMPVGQIDAKGEITPVSLPLAAPNVAVKVAEIRPPVAPSAAGVLPPEKKKEFKARFSEYSQRILPGAGGMVPTDGIGGVTMKLRMFAEKFTGATDMNEVQSETFLKFLDDYVKESGAPALVQYIDKAIGATKS